MSLTGVNTERVDTRVVQVIYANDPNHHLVKEKKLLMGQLLDVFIDTRPGKSVCRMTRYSAAHRCGSHYLNLDLVSDYIHSQPVTDFVERNLLTVEGDSPADEDAPACNDFDVQLAETVPMTGADIRRQAMEESIAVSQRDESGHSGGLGKGRGHHFVG